MTEMILPGTYIEVRAEGLIAAGPISIGNVGIVGTASRGRMTGKDITLAQSAVYTPGSLAEATDIFGPAATADLTLTRALALAYANGAQNVFVVRVGHNDAGKAKYTLKAGGTGSVTFEALSPGTGYNGATIAVSPGTKGTPPLRNVNFSLGRLTETWRDVPAAVADFAAVINGTSPTYSYNTLASTGGGSSLFAVDAGGATGDVPEHPEGDAEKPATATSSVDGANGGTATLADYQAGLDALLNQNVHIVILAGQSGPEMASALVAHCEAASVEPMNRERIGVIGSPSPVGDATAVIPVAQDEGRLIWVAPGIQTSDPATGKPVTLSGAYAAAAVAGRIASLDPHASPTNKTLNVAGLEKEFNGTELEQLVLQSVLALESRAGTVRIVKGLTTAPGGSAWTQITTRRIVDYARFGVRSACNPYIGKLNNDRVRQAMKSTITGFLADMVDQEMLISYTLDVSATRAQQIRGIAQVTMVLQPTFSIDYIRVIMNLQ